MARNVTISSVGPLIIIMLLFLRGCYEEVPVIHSQPQDGAETILSFDQVKGMVDWQERTIMFTIGANTINSFSPEIKFYGYDSFQFDGKKLADGQINEL